MEPHVNLLNTTSAVVCYSIWRVAIVAEVSSFNLNLVCAEAGTLRTIEGRNRPARINDIRFGERFN